MTPEQKDAIRTQIRNLQTQRLAINAKIKMLKASLKTPRCKHPLAKNHTFTDGKNIAICPDCTTFDKKRHDVLTTPWWEFQATPSVAPR